jgi:hypothetical protein
MWLFTSFANVFESSYGRVTESLKKFDSSETLWRQRKTKVAEFWAWRNLQEEIYKQQAEQGDLMTKTLLDLDKLDLDQLAKK